MASDVIENAVNWAINIAKDDSHGYDLANRWGPDYDCSSLVISAFKQAGVNLTCTYTGNMRVDMLKHGFIEVPLKDRQRGDVLLNEKSHTALMINNKELVHASINENGRTVGGKRGDQTKREICIREYYRYSSGWDYCLRYAGNMQEVAAKPQEFAKKFRVISTSGLRIRAGRTINALQVGVYNYGDVMTVYDIVDGWARVGVDMYVCADYIKAV